jgi:hypothetical protein
VPNFFVTTLFFSPFSKRPIIPIFSSNVNWWRATWWNVYTQLTLFVILWTLKHQNL